MSVVGQALVMVLSRALKGRTLAGQRVLEQPIDPITELFPESASKGNPVIAVYCQESEGNPIALETQRGPTKVTIKAIGYIPPVVEIQDEALTVKFENSGSGFVLSAMARQIDAALHVGNLTWVRLFRRLACSIESRKSRFLLIELENGVRIPSIEVEYQIEAVQEPEMGVPLFGAWLDMDAGLRAEGPEGVIVADMLKGLIEKPFDLPEHLVWQNSVNLTDAAAITSGLGPIVLDDDGNPIPLAGATNDVEIEIVPPEVD